MARTKFSNTLFATMMGRICAGESIAQICLDDDMPSQAGFYKWLNEKPELVEIYARARETQAHAIFDEILQIADDARNDWMERHGEDDAGWQANHEHIQRSRLRIDARKWMAAKLAPKKYGDRLDLNHGGTVETKTTIDPSKLPTEAMEALLAARRNKPDE